MPTIAIFLARYGGYALWKVGLAIVASLGGAAGAGYALGKKKRK